MQSAETRAGHGRCRIELGGEGAMEKECSEASRAQIMKGHAEKMAILLRKREASILRI